MCAELVPLVRCAIDAQNSQTIAIHDGQLVDKEQFCADVADKVTALRQLPVQQFALYYESAYPFCVLLFALLHSGKSVWIPGNNRPGTAEKLTRQGCQLLGEWQGRELQPDSDDKTGFALTALDLHSAQLTIFTSGSTGQPKAIRKSLLQLQREVETLEQQWGKLLGQAQVLATVSHQHIYGLLFRVLWPLASGRCFHSQMYLSPEPMLNAAAGRPSYWVASPAQLKRLDDLTPWEEMSHLTTIFSSGGALADDVVKQIQKNSGQKVLEIYGSSETGGIAWRSQCDDELWIPFRTIKLQAVEGRGFQLCSPYLPDQTPFLLDDKIDLHDDGRFALLGRLDRIVKVEEKRLSLDELEQTLNKSAWVELSHTLLLANKRDRIGAVIVLTAAGKDYLQQHGRAAIIKQLRMQLMDFFETVVLPRKWLFMQSMPVSTQGKTDTDLMTKLLILDSTKFPQIQYCDLQRDKVELQLRVQVELVYFAGHFPEQPILPGVTQLAWAEHYGKLFFGIDQPFLRMEVIKFKKIIRPGDVITMHLNWKAESNKLYFDLSSVSDSHSSGRMVYGESA